MVTAVIGLGAIGGAVAKNLAEGGTDVIVSERDFVKAQSRAKELGPHAIALTIDDAVKAADIIILAIWFDAIKSFLASHQDDLSGKIIVDPSNPIESDGKGGFKKTIPQDQSSGELVASLLPNGAKLVKAFGSLAAPTLASAANRRPEKAVLFYASDDEQAGTEVAKLIAASGFTPMGIGRIDQSIRMEVFGDLHEFGKLGKTVSASEAKAAVDAMPAVKP